METHDVSEFNQPNQAATCPSQDTAANGTCAASASIGYFLVSSGNLRFQQMGQGAKKQQNVLSPVSISRISREAKRNHPSDENSAASLRKIRAKPPCQAAQTASLSRTTNASTAVQSRCFPALHVGLKMTGRGFRRVRVWLKNHSWKWTSFCEQHLRICHQAHHSG